VDYAPLRIDVFNERVTAAGELDLTTSPVVDDAVVELAGPDRLIDLDLSQITFMDSSGLNALLRLRETVPTLRVVAVSNQIRRLLEMTGLTTLLDTSNTSPLAGRGLRAKTFG
jgi:anti-sigma B factor antagonist